MACESGLCRFLCGDLEVCEVQPGSFTSAVRRLFCRPLFSAGTCYVISPVIIPPAVSSIWMNLSDDQEANVLQTLKELPKCFSRAELDQQFEQRGLLNVFINPQTSHILSLSCNPWEVGANVDLMYFSPKLKRV